jgi:hypothetical protein
MPWKYLKNKLSTEVNWKTEEVHVMVLSDRHFNINKLGVSTG